MKENIKNLNSEIYSIYGPNINNEKIATSNIIAFSLAVLFIILMTKTLKIVSANIITGSILGIIYTLVYVITTNKIFSKLFK